MRVLGIDPGSTLIGYALIEELETLKSIKYGLLEIKEKNPTKRLKEIDSRLSSLIKEEKIDVAGVEKIFFAKNKKTAIEVAQARGVILAVLLRRGIEIIEITPIQIKSSITGSSSADKISVAKMASKILNLKEVVKEDNTADALAIAITTASHYKRKKLEEN